MTYNEALEESRRVGAAKAKGEAFLADVCQTLSFAHAVNPQMLFDGAKKKNLDGLALARLAHEDVGKFAFIQFA